MNHVRDAFTNQGYDVYYVFECPECGYERYEPAQQQRSSQSSNTALV